jgi:ubiquinone/menaquinone biosynthesis C-methylase UbiE
MPNYGDATYWEQRYADQEGTTFDWLEDYSALKQLIESFVDNTAKVLVLGCGNAEFSEEMYKDGFTNIDNIDISAVVISQMAARNSDKPEMTWTVMDVRDLKFPDNTFDLAVDKSTIDALLCGEQAFYNVALMTREVQRVLKVGGTYMAISYGTPDNRLEHFNFQHLNWTVSHLELGSASNLHYVYNCKKQPGSSEHAAANWDDVASRLQGLED